jgi:antitoxin VapB
MGLNLKNPKTEANIRALAEQTGESLTDAIDGAVREKLERLKAAAEDGRVDTPLLDRLQPLLAAIAAERAAKGDARTSGEMLDELYDEHGLPA